MLFAAPLFNFAAKTSAESKRNSHRRSRFKSQKHLLHLRRF
jgi:hypothetical protein